VCGVWCVVCGVRCAVCGVWCVVTAPGLSVPSYCAVLHSVYICICIYIYVCVYISLAARLSRYMYVCVYEYKRIYIYIYIYLPSYRAAPHTAYIYLYMCIYVNTYISLYVYMCIYVGTLLYIKRLTDVVLQTEIHTSHSDTSSINHLVMRERANSLNSSVVSRSVSGPSSEYSRQTLFGI